MTMSDKRPTWLHTASDHHYVTVAPHDGAVPGTKTYTLQVPLSNGETLVLQGGEGWIRELARRVEKWLAEIEAGECRRACCLAAPALPGFERLVAA